MSVDKGILLDHCLLRSIPQERTSSTWCPAVSRTVQGASGLIDGAIQLVDGLVYSVRLVEVCDIFLGHSVAIAVTSLSLPLPLAGPSQDRNIWA